MMTLRRYVKVTLGPYTALSGVGNAVVIPANVYSIVWRVVAAGGGGGGGTFLANPGQGGDGGAYFESNPIPVTPGETLFIDHGAGGTNGNVGGGDGTDGGITQLRRGGTQTNPASGTVLASITGGKLGQGNQIAAKTSPAPATAFNGTIVNRGEVGQNGTSGGQNTYGGAAGANNGNLTSGARTGSGAAAPGDPGNQYGGGGGGGRGNAGAAGGVGNQAQSVIDYTKSV